MSGNKAFFLAGSVAAIIALIDASPASATEGGGQDYAIGVNNVLSGLEPPPGETRYYDYLQRYSADRFNGDNGHSKIANFGAEVNVNAFRVVHSWDTVGPFTILSILVVPLSNVRLQVGSREKELTGIGDISIQPLFFDWSNQRKNFFVSFGPGLYVPSGSYDQSRLANLGRNTTVFFHQLGMTWFITKRLEVSTGTTFELHSYNPATHYRSGSDIDTDFEITGQPFKLNPHIHVGLNGYFYDQLGDDRVHGDVVPGGNRGRVFSLGPIIRMDLHRSAVAFKYEREFDVRNRPEGNRFWFQFTIPLSRARPVQPQPPSHPPVTK